MKAYAVILGGGSGTRMGGDRNKVFLPIRGIPAIVRATVPFTGLCAGAVFVAQADEITAMEAIVTQFGLSRFAVAVVAGGEHAAGIRVERPVRAAGGRRDRADPRRRARAGHGGRRHPRAAVRRRSAAPASRRFP